MSKTLKPATPKEPTRPPPGDISRAGAATAESYRAELATDGSSAPALPKVPPSPPFLYAWHPARWVVLAGRLVPSLRKVALQPGINRVRRLKDGRIDVGECRAHLERRGWTLIAQSASPDGRSYLKRVRTALGPEGSFVHLSLWESVYPGSDQIGADVPGYADWLDRLVTEGVIPVCPPHIAETLRDRHATTLAAYEERIQRGGVSYQPAAQRLREDLAVLESYLERASKPAERESAAADQVDLDDLEGV